MQLHASSCPLLKSQQQSRLFPYNKQSLWKSSLVPSAPGARVARPDHSRGCSVVVKGGLMDELMDGITAQRKLRRWYGAGQDLPRDGGAEDGDGVSPGSSDGGQGDQEAGPPESVLVLDSGTPTGEQVVLQLILRRAKVCLLVRDPSAAKAAYGPYTTPLQGTSSDPEALRSALTRARCVVVPGRVTPALTQALRGWRGHVVLVSCTGSKQGVLSALVGGEASVLREESRERDIKAVAAAAAPPGANGGRGGCYYTIVRAAGGLSNSPGGTLALTLQQAGAGGGNGSDTPISREDLARIVTAAALEQQDGEAETGGGPQPAVPSLEIQVVCSDAGTPPSDEEMAAALAGLRRQTA